MSCVDRRLRARLDSERETCDALRLELAESKRGHQSQQQRDSKKLEDQQVVYACDSRY